MIEQIEAIAVTQVSTGIGNRILLVKGMPPLELAYSDDDGMTYTTVHIGREGERITHPSALLVTERNHVFLATSQARIYRSLDWGETWSVVEDGVFFNSGFIHMTESLGRIFALCVDGIIFSDDCGDTWNYSQMPNWSSD